MVQVLNAAGWVFFGFAIGAPTWRLMLLMYAAATVFAASADQLARIRRGVTP